MSRSTLIFGGSGFIGSHLLRRLVSEGETSIISVDRKPPPARIKGVEYREADVRKLSEFIPPATVTRIYNFAAVHTTPGHADHEYYETNVLGALEVTKLAARCDVAELIFTSSIAIYGPSETMKTEQTEPAPVSAYGYSKMLAERIHQQWFEAAIGRRLTIVRPAAVFGAGEGGNFARMAGLLRKGFFVYPGRKDTIKACIYVEDLLDAIEFSRQQEEPSVLFNAAYPQRYTLEAIVNALVSQHFPSARTYVVPRNFVLGVVRILRALNLFNVGIHPDRVTKLVRSTDVYPDWLTRKGLTFPNALESAIDRWAVETNGSFV